jgi:hypothetical protein
MFVMQQMRQKRRVVAGKLTFPFAFPRATWEYDMGHAAYYFLYILNLDALTAIRGVARASAQLRTGLDCIPTQRMGTRY